MKILAPTLRRGAPSVGHGEFYVEYVTSTNVMMSFFSGVGHGTVSSNVV
jgi:hypothetical protein